MRPIGGSCAACCEGASHQVIRYAANQSHLLEVRGKSAIQTLTAVSAPFAHTMPNRCPRLRIASARISVACVGKMRGLQLRVRSEGACSSVRGIHNRKTHAPSFPPPTVRRPGERG
jgi:hypothetical protein